MTLSDQGVRLSRDLGVDSITSPSIVCAYYDDSI